MYLDFTLRKVSFIVGLTLLLSLFVYSTNVAKLNIFGSTPFFYSVTVGGTYILNSVVANIQKSALFAAMLFVRDSDTEKAEAVPVLTYHRIVQNPNDTANVSTAMFREQMAELKNAGWKTVTLEEFENFIAGKGTLPERSFLLTFDDGAKESFYPVDPVLQAYDYHAVMYTIVASSKIPESTYYLSPEEHQWILKTGRWSIGSHSYDGHRPYAATADGTEGVFFADRIWIPEESRLESAEEFRTRVHTDLQFSKDELESTYARQIDTFAFPLGNETGIVGANNFPEGAAITEAEARSIYTIGFLQTNNQGFTFNFPTSRASSTDPISAARNMMATDFIVRRIHVDHDWDGKRLLSILENGRKKTLPFEDDFEVDKGWIRAWGETSIGRNNFTLNASRGLTSASTFLDGSEFWNDYAYDASVNWEGGYLFMLADVTDSKTYDACVFSPGKVEIQISLHGETRTIATVQDPRVQYGTNAQPGIRVHGSVIECTWGFSSILEGYERTHAGGIGIQVWDPTRDTAHLQVTSIIAREYASVASQTAQ